MLKICYTPLAEDSQSSRPSMYVERLRTFIRQGRTVYSEHATPHESLRFEIKIWPSKNSYELFQVKSGRTVTLDFDAAYGGAAGQARPTQLRVRRVRIYEKHDHH